METSTTTTDITAALLSFHEKALIIGKNSENPAFKSGPRGSASKYASLAHIMGGIAAPLADCGLCYVQFPDGDALTTRLMHKSGEWMQASLTMRPTQNTPQAHGSAITYAKRYALVAILGLRIDGDDDGNAASAPAPAAPVAAPNELLIKAVKEGLLTAKSMVALKEIWDSLAENEQTAIRPDFTTARTRIASGTIKAANTPL